MAVSVQVCKDDGVARAVPKRSRWEEEIHWTAIYVQEIRLRQVPPTSEHEVESPVPVYIAQSDSRRPIAAT
jgi:hypothetical protein